MQTKNGNCRKPQHTTKHPIWQSCNDSFQGICSIYILFLPVSSSVCVCHSFLSSHGHVMVPSRWCPFYLYIFIFFSLLAFLPICTEQMCAISPTSCVHINTPTAFNIVDQAIIWYITFRQGLTLFEFTYLQNIINHNIILRVLSQNVSLVIKYMIMSYCRTSFDY